MVPTKEDVFEALRAVEDPELGMDIVELGLLYDVEVDGPKVKVIHTLTSMGCPVGPMIQENVDQIVRAMPEVDDVHAELRVLDLAERVDDFFAGWHACILAAAGCARLMVRN